MKRVILKISGEALKDNDNQVANNKLNIVLDTIKILKKYQYKVGIVVGGGNFFRGREHSDMNKVTADTIGMLGTVMNALHLKDYLEKNNLKCVVSTPFQFPDLIEDLSDEELREKYDNNEVIIFGGGIGKSGYSTDSGTILASEKLKSDLIIKMTNVDGVYDSDPKINKNAHKFDRLNYQEVLDKNLEVMDSYAIKKCQEMNTNILVMNFLKFEEIENFINGDMIGTLIGD